ncbi:MAG: 50S ribosomal protein L29 [Leptospiraceae bacterium]|nr:50S ribosomal protein L29 [Leptospiraceae bacterium]
MAVSYHEMTEKELDKQLESFRKELRELRFTYAVTRSLQNSARPRLVKRSIARILTIKRERELKAAKGGA